MKIRQMILPLMVFIAFLLFGRWTGEQIEKSVLASGQLDVEEKRLAEITRFDQPLFSENSFAPMSPASVLPDPFVEEPGYNHQKNLLVVGVDDLSKPQPNLEGIWLVLYLPEMPLVTLMPIYPTVSAQAGNLQFTADAELASSFKLTAGGFPHPVLLNKLEEKGLWWTNIAVLDGIALQGLLHFTGGLNSGSGSEMKRGLAASEDAALPDPTNEPQAALLFQAQTIQELCHTGNPNFSASQVAEFIGSLEGHITTDLSSDQVINDLKSMLLYGGGFICEFPSLTLDSGSL